MSTQPSQGHILTHIIVYPCHNKLDKLLLLNLFVFGSCLRTLAVILVSEFFFLLLSVSLAGLFSEVRVVRFSVFFSKTFSLSLLTSPTAGVRVRLKS